MLEIGRPVTVIFQMERCVLHEKEKSIHHTGYAHHTPADQSETSSALGLGEQTLMSSLTKSVGQSERNSSRNISDEEKSCLQTARFVCCSACAPRLNSLSHLSFTFTECRFPSSFVFVAPLFLTYCATLSHLQ